MDMQDYRKRMDEIDERLIRAFDDRMRISLEIAKHKKAHSLPVLDAEREQAVLIKQTAAVQDELAPYVKQFYATIFDISRQYQQRYISQSNHSQKVFGLIGENLSHSHSQTLHGLLADYQYHLWSIPPQGLDAFFRQASFDGLNVTIPYKQAVIPYLDKVGETAQRIGSVNTIVRQADGTLFGDNTDAYGMFAMSKRAGIDFSGKKTLVLGSGGTSLTACDVVHQSGGEALVISRHGESCYDTIEQHADADYLINTTPVGMYPNVDEQPIDLKRLPCLKGVLDVVYNPLRTRLLMQAQQLGIPCEGGLSMLVGQAVRACELFTGEIVSPDRAIQAGRALRKSVTNLVLIGMPGCGKTTIGRLLSERLQMMLVDIDTEIEQSAALSISEIFALEGEEGFRKREAACIQRFARKGGQVLVTGGGAITSEMNRIEICRNGFVVHITRCLDALCMEERPLSKNREAVRRLWFERKDLYDECADCSVSNDGKQERCAQKVEEAFREALCH